MRPGRRNVTGRYEPARLGPNSSGVMKAVYSIVTVFGVLFVALNLSALLIWVERRCLLFGRTAMDRIESGPSACSRCWLTR